MFQSDKTTGTRYKTSSGGSITIGGQNNGWVADTITMGDVTFGSGKKKKQKNKMKDPLIRYLKGFENQKETYPAAFERLGLEEDESLCCPISHAIPEIPVYMDGVLFDYKFLEALPTDNEGRRTNPMNNLDKFTMRDVQRAPRSRDEIEKQISKAEALASEKIDNADQSSVSYTM